MTEIPRTPLGKGQESSIKKLPRHVAFEKLKAMTEAAATVRKEIS